MADFLLQLTDILHRIPRPSHVMENLCNAFADPASGVNACQQIRMDPRCIVDDKMTIEQSLETALWTPPDCPNGAEMRRKICECSCWSKIVDVYTPMFQQWADYDVDVEAKLIHLQTMCARNTVGSISVEIEESTKVQCEVNTITLRLTSSVDLPRGTVVTVTGLNAMPVDAELVLASVGDVMEKKASWVDAHCNQWCSEIGLCLHDGSATSTGCLAHPPVSVSSVAENRCLRWCDSNAVLRATLSSHVSMGTALTMSMRLINPSMMQHPVNVSVSASGTGLYVPSITASPRFVGVRGVLSADSVPRFINLNVTEGVCPVNLDDNSQEARGKCAGMLNTVSFSMTPNVALLPGARITVSGLQRSGSIIWPEPTLLGNNTLRVDMWKSDRGVLVLRVIEEAFGANEQINFQLEMKMPQVADDPDIVRDPVSVTASHGGDDLFCSFQEIVSATTVLIAVRPVSFDFSLRHVSQTTCHPGECNEIIMNFAVNNALDESSGEVMILFTGFQGMDRSLDCYSTKYCSNDGESIPLIDVVGGNEPLTL